jgi:predicted ATPase
VVVAGEAGIGKTRLATEFLSWAQVQGADVLTGRAFEAECGLPYAPLVMALRERLERENAPEDLVEDVWLAELARLLPELRERYPDLSRVAGDAGEARACLFEAVARLLRGLAGRQPVALVLDDAQWADGATRDLLRYLVQRVARARLLVVLALRAEDAALRPELIVWLAGLARDGAARRLDLAPLGPTDTLRLVAGLAEAGSCDAGCAARETGVSRLGAWIHTQTGGRPFVILEILRALVAEGALGLRADDRARYALDVPANWHAPAGTVGMMTVQLREVLGARLAQLDPLARQVLLVGALLGDSFTLEQVCQAAEVSEQAAVGALDLLARACLLEEDGTPGCYTLAYDMLRTVVRAQAGAARRQVMSRRMEAERVAAHTLSRPIARQGYPRHRHGGGLPGQASVPRCKVPNPVNLACAS